MNFNPLKSRTTWLQIGIIAIAILNAVTPFIPHPWNDMVSAVLAILAVYTHSDGMTKAGAVN